MKNIAIVDAGPLIALFDKNDSYHKIAVEKINFFRDRHGRIITTLPAITEAMHILHREIGIKAEINLLKWLDLFGGLEIYPVTEHHIARIMALKKKYQDIPMDFADSSLIIAAEELNTNLIFSIDDDFKIHRIFKKKSFINLMM